jgi:hypothetical protein
VKDIREKSEGPGRAMPKKIDSSAKKQQVPGEAGRAPAKMSWSGKK